MRHVKAAAGAIALPTGVHIGWCALDPFEKEDVPLDDMPDGLIPSPPPPREPPALLADDHGIGKILWQTITRSKVTAVTRPQPLPDVQGMSPLVRVHACLRRFLLDVEFALSPGGQLRAMFKWMCRIHILIAFASLCMASALGCMALVVAVLAIIAQRLAAALWLLLQAAILVVALLAIAAGLMLAVHLFSRFSRRNSAVYLRRRGSGRR